MALRQRGIRAVLLVLLVGIAACSQAGSAPLESAETPPPVIEIAFIDVGQGDAALITGTDGRYVLVDAGPRGSGVAEYLRQRRIDTLELVVASHNHADHIGGLLEVLEAVVVRNYMENGLPSPTATYARLVNLIAQSGARVLGPTPRTLGLGDVRIEVLPSPPRVESQNNRSVGLVVRLGEFAALFTGDAEPLALAYWLEDRPLTRMSVVKVPHHGSRNGTTPELAQATRPSLAVFSLGGRNPYGHPAPEVLHLWEEFAPHVLRTDQHGTITVIATPDGAMTIRTERGNPALRIFVPPLSTSYRERDE